MTVVIPRGEAIAAAAAVYLDAKVRIATERQLAAIKERAARPAPADKVTSAA